MFLSCVDPVISALPLPDSPEESFVSPSIVSYSCASQDPGWVSHRLLPRTLALENGEGRWDLGNYFQQYGLNEMAASGHGLGNPSCGLFSLDSSLFLPPGSPAFVLT